MSFIGNFVTWSKFGSSDRVRMLFFQEVSWWVRFYICQRFWISLFFFYFFFCVFLLTFLGAISSWLRGGDCLLTLSVFFVEFRRCREQNCGCLYAILFLLLKILFFFWENKQGVLLIWELKIRSWKFGWVWCMQLVLRLFQRKIWFFWWGWGFWTFCVELFRVFDLAEVLQGLFLMEIDCFVLISHN